MMMRYLSQGRYLSIALVAAVVAATVASVSAEQDSGEGKNTILIEDFANPIHKWTTMNDPVMGGQSHSSLAIENGVAKFTGKCAIVPFLQAPGFITMVTGDFFSFHPETFPDVSTCSGLAFSLKSNTPDYKGYRISFGKVHVKGGHHAYGYKAGPLLNIGDDFGTITIPFEKFSSKWDDATGDITVTCQEDSQYCPNDKWLSNMKTMSFWAEGVEGTIDLEIQKIWAVNCNPQASLLAAASLLQANSGGMFHSIAGGSGGGHIPLLVCLMAMIGVMAVLFTNNKKRQNQTTTRRHEEYEEIPQEAVL